MRVKTHTDRTAMAQLAARMVAEMTMEENSGATADMTARSTGSAIDQKHRAVYAGNPHVRANRHIRATDFPMAIA